MRLWGWFIWLARCTGCDHGLEAEAVGQVGIAGRVRFIGEWPEAVGLDDAAFPVGYVRQLLYPFRHDPLTEVPEGEVSTR